MRRILDLKEHELYLELEDDFRERVMPVIDRINVRCAGETCYVRVESAYRSSALQLEKWRQGRERVEGFLVTDWRRGWKRTGSIVTKAPPGFSAHEYRLAIHAVLKDDATAHWLLGMERGKPDPRWRIVGEEAQAADLVWGGTWADPYDPAHIEDPGWKSVARATGWKGLP